MLRGGTYKWGLEGLVNLKNIIAATCVAVAALGVGAANAAVYVSEVVSFDPGTGNRGPDGGGTSIADAFAKVGGAPDGNFLSLGLGGGIVLGFGAGPFQGASVLFEVTNGCGVTCGSWPESVSVSTSMNEAGSWDYVGTLTNSAAPTEISGNTRGYLLNITTPFRYLYLVDTSPTSPSGNSNAGWDIDAVSVAPIPVPAALPLLVAGIGGLAWAGRRRKNAA